MVSRGWGPTKRSDASLPVRASGDSDARSSIAIRSSSAKSMSSSAMVARPRASASSLAIGPSAPRARMVATYAVAP